MTEEQSYRLQVYMGKSGYQNVKRLANEYQVTMSQWAKMGMALLEKTLNNDISISKTSSAKITALYVQGVPEAVFEELKSTLEEHDIKVQEKDLDKTIWEGWEKYKEK